MLSRVAENLYWMSRYLERAEHTARLLDVNLHGGLDATPQSAARRWERLLAALHMPLPSDAVADVRSITQALAFDTSHPGSIVSCVIGARDNARQAWEQISSEMCEQINRLFLYVSRQTVDELWYGEPHAFFAVIKEGSHLFQGVTDATMSHGEGWHFIQVGRCLERTSLTAILLDTHFNAKSESADGESLDFLEWVGLLKSCTAFEAYVKIFSPHVEPQNIAAFLLLNTDFPRSMRFTATGIRSGLHAIGRLVGGHGVARPERLAGRLQAALEYSQIDEIMSDDLHAYLEFIGRQCTQIHGAIQQTFVHYPVAGALVAEARQAR
jgi:uncharacterized alpha-E superfamily protein